MEILEESWNLFYTTKKRFRNSFCGLVFRSGQEIPASSDWGDVASSEINFTDRLFKSNYAEIVE